MSDIDFENNSTDILMNPRFPEQEKQQLVNALEKAPHLESHVWLATSGTSSRCKWVALSKPAILTSAASVNQHLQATANDRWLNPLPSFHVGGIGIHARAKQSNSEVFTIEKWQPQHFWQSINANQITLTALVPAQIFDLLTLGLPAPSSLRAVLVGGGALPEAHFEKAWELGWPLLPSYGLTECASQVATAELGSRSSKLKVLSHVELRTDEQQILHVKSPSLLSLYGVFHKDEMEFYDPKVDGFLAIEDRGIIENGYLHVLGRNSHFVKIGGESVDLLRLENILEKAKLALARQEAVLVPIQDERLGHVIHLCVANMDQEKVDQLIKHYNEQVMPFEKVRKAHFLDVLPRNDLGKVIQSKLLELIHAN